jgi:hypothetical protein
VTDQANKQRTVLHIGLHKTATRFLQRAVFRSLDSRQFLVNPEVLEKPLKRALRSPGAANVEAAHAAAAAARDQAGTRTLVISDPTISGDMYSSHEDYQRNLELVHDLFPEARVIYFVRRQSDWLLSAYRQALVKGPGMPIERFLNHYEGEFRPRVARRVHGVRNVEALTLRFLDIYRAYADRFGPEQVYLFRQEDLRHDRDAVYARLAEALGLEALPRLPERVSGNRGFSALAIRLFFAGTGRTPRPPRPEDAEPPAPATRRRHPMRRLRTAFIRHVFDKLIYKDWDLLAHDGMRARLDAHYADDFETLARVAHTVLREGPGPAARARAAGGEGPSGASRSAAATPAGRP